MLSQTYFKKDIAEGKCSHREINFRWLMHGLRQDDSAPMDRGQRCAIFKV